MDLNTIAAVVRPRTRAEIPPFRPGDAYLAGGTWLYSEPQTHLRRLIDVSALQWPALERTGAGLLVGATCTLADLEAYVPPPHWLGAAMIGQCCRALLGSFKIRSCATVGGNLCLALAASPMAALAVAMEGVCTIWAADGGSRECAADALITGDATTTLAPGELLRSVLLAEPALRRRAAFRQMSLTPLGRSAALLIGTRDEAGIALTVTASVAHPIRLRVAGAPTRAVLQAAVDHAVPCWFDDVHGRPAWRRRITHLLAAEICDELAA